jgi:hypothetical protein
MKLKNIPIEQKARVVFMLVNLAAGMILALWLALLCNPAAFNDSFYVNSFLYILLSLLLILSVKINTDVVKKGLVEGLALNPNKETKEGKQGVGQ